MEIKLNFLGAAQNVTGSRHLLEVNGSNILVDCGLYQERQFRDRNWEDFPFPPKKIDAVLLTHAHLDHCGLLPKLVREGFDGPIYCTPATADIAKIILLDSAKLQEEDAEHKRKRHEKEGRKGPYPEIPLYTTEEADEIAQSIYDRLALNFIEGEVQIIGNPSIELGSLIELTDFGDRFSGKYLVSGVEHIMSQTEGQGYKTIIHFRGNAIKK